MNILCAWLLIPSGMTPQDETRSEEVVSAEGINSQKTGQQSLYDTAVYYLKWSVLKVSTAQGIDRNQIIGFFQFSNF